MKVNISLLGMVTVRKFVSLIALLLVAHMMAAPDALALQNTSKDGKREAQVKAKAEALGAGVEVTVSMRDGSKQNGRIRQSTDQNLILDKNGQTETIPFAQVSKIDRHKPIWARKALWGAIIAGAVFAILAITKPLKD